MNECAFCKHMEFLKGLEEDFQNNPNRYNKESHTYALKSALIHQSYYEGRPTGSSTVEFSLNFCPECGRKIGETEKGSAVNA